ncbi:class I SAM-dependent methyltransferase [Nocardioides sp. MH1]|uniref:class I SAM-dependent methyltransferase n=1 Tax=Nocardioides sp. MH1 TaxID=3242490 RepID=UPI00352077BF
MRKDARAGDAADLDIDPVAELAVVDARYLEARGEDPSNEPSNEPSDELVEAAFRLSLLEPAGDWTSDVVQAKVAYFHFAPDLEAALRNYDPHLVDLSARFGYLTWPRRIREHVRGRSVLDVGCRFGGFGMGFLVAGATSYVGVDPMLDLDSTRARDKRRRAWGDMGITPRQISEQLPALRSVRGAVEDGAVDGTFDTIAMHNVTERLHNLDDVLVGLTKLCHRDTRLVLLHHSFYGWSGHHQAPVQPEQLDEDDPRHQLVYDWRHINAVPDLADDHPMIRVLNRIRLDDLRSMIEQHFDVERWDEIPSRQQALDRLTPEVLARVRETVPDITERELSTNTVLVVARPKS